MITNHRALSSLLVILICGCIANANEPPDLLNDPDPSIRLKAWNSIANSSEEVLKRIDQLVPMLPIGLRDPDHNVRLEVAKMAAVIALAGHQQKKYQLQNKPEMVSALLALLRDRDTEIRKLADTALSLGVEPTPALGELLLARYSEETDPNRRAELIGVLLMTSGKKWPNFKEREPTDAVLTIIVKALDDSNKTIQLAGIQAITSLKTPPAEALPKLVGMLNLSDPFFCQFVISAIGHYGSAASSYLPNLEKLRLRVGNVEDSPERKSLRDNLDIGIHTIREASEKDKTEVGKK